MTFTFKKMTTAALLLVAAANVFGADEALSAAELKAQKMYIDDAFAKMDGNGDGKIDKAEWTQFMTVFLKTKRVQFGALFDAADTNHDGKLSKDETRQANPMLLQHFAEMDTNHDSFLTPAEIRAAINSATQQ